MYTTHRVTKKVCEFRLQADWKLCVSCHQACGQFSADHHGGKLRREWLAMEDVYIADLAWTSSDRAPLQGAVQDDLQSVLKRYSP